MAGDSPAWQQAVQPPGQTCQNNDANWQNVAEPWVAFFHAACPTAYTYPFDDPTSTFTRAPASGGGGGGDGVAYDVTFCP